MKAYLKSKDRRIAFWLSFIYVLILTAILLYLHAKKIEVVSFWPIFSGTLGFLGTLGVANYATTPKDTYDETVEREHD